MNSTIRSSVNRSGNSKVIVYVDTIAIALAHLCGMHASGQLNDLQFHNAIKEFSELLAKEEFRVDIADALTRNQVRGVGAKARLAQNS